MGRCPAVFVSASLPGWESPSMAACRPRPWGATLAGSMLLDRLDAAGARAPFAFALAGRAPFRRPHGGTRGHHGDGSATAGHGPACRRFSLGATSGLAQMVWACRAERLDRGAF